MSGAEVVQKLKKSGEHCRVMIVDDSVLVQKQMSAILASEGFEVVETAGDGEEALEKYRENKNQIDLITMDITMPKMDGITALSKLIEFNPKVVVVMVSAVGKENLVKKSLLIGAKNYVVKPLTREKVVPRVTSALQYLDR
ncbi:response regulator [Candidatus Haliotispira prima]|uniref:Response regulator n=1 Tax=Candidatus Haliotispira prima TaxID=3034016 RepID=A0ABY8MLD0_9SPIO|nr:response regulator [Candidatus Haliotispira prima]